MGIATAASKLAASHAGHAAQPNGKGRTILVEVLPKQFRFDNRAYPSLSAIAVAITGLAFVGLTRPADSK